MGVGKFFVKEGESYGFGIEDIFVFVGMYEVVLFLVGGILMVVDWVMLG